MTQKLNLQVETSPEGTRAEFRAKEKNLTETKMNMIHYETAWLPCDKVLNTSLI